MEIESMLVDFKHFPTTSDACELVFIKLLGQLESHERGRVIKIIAHIVTAPVHPWKFLEEILLHEG